MVEQEAHLPKFHWIPRVRAASYLTMAMAMRVVTRNVLGVKHLELHYSQFGNQ